MDYGHQADEQEKRNNLHGKPVLLEDETTEGLGRGYGHFKGDPAARVRKNQKHGHREKDQTQYNGGRPLGRRHPGFRGRSSFSIIITKRNRTMIAPA